MNLKFLKRPIQAQIEEFGEYFVHINKLRFNLIYDFEQSEGIIFKKLEKHLK